MILNNEKRERLIKLLNLTTSPEDGEALVAIRKANALLRNEKVLWDAFVIIEAKPQAARAGDEFDGVDWDDVFELLLDRVKDDGGRTFLESVHSFWEKRGYLSRAQKEGVWRFYENHC